MLLSLAPTAVRELNAFPSSPESIFITWDHPEYPNSQLLEYFIFYQMDPLVVQQTPNISSDEFLSVTSPADSASLTFNLTGLSVFTNYSIHMTVSADGEEDAPIEVEILSRTNTTGEFPTYSLTECIAAGPAESVRLLRFWLDLFFLKVKAKFHFCKRQVINKVLV